ncbi:protein STRUBBELIG-RECEPTOR FAMILY 3-like [Canna indica]|uniref:Protein STRUBBELIG-RECEPTOR FAMILY 3-like n=1 Tax=Canna indica TaxID=4628 RepID=A0AAQ3KZL2_9LILI|nr:protein STRUBBELIG-RECEPTOR FAMILY 3-like [Canna indica]
MGMRMFSWVLALTVLFCMPLSNSYTYEQDVYAINYLYFSLGFPLLPGWRPLGGDPCVDAWQGVECVNSNITAIILNGANLAGELGDKLVNFTSLITMDLSNNQIGGSIPEKLPITIRNFLSANQLTGSIPGSLAELTLLSDMSLNNNLLSGQLPDAFQSLTGLINLDISGNNLSGQLPPSMGSLSSLTTLHIQNNQLSGTLDVLQDLPLQDLNVENNMFSGPIPEKLLDIPNFKKDGNPFNTSIAPSPFPSPPTTLPFSPSRAPSIAPASPSEGPTQNGSKISIVKVVGCVGAGVVLLAIIVLMVILYVSKCQKKIKNGDQTSKSYDLGKQGRPKEPQMTIDFIKPHKGERAIAEPIQRQEYDLNVQGTTAFPMPPRIDKDTVPPIVTGERILGNRAEILKPPTSAKPFSVASLQQYTNSFNEENLIQDGRLGRVYLAEFPQGKLLAVLKLDSRNSNLLEDQFLKLLNIISGIQHQNIVELVGYSVDFGQRLLVYNFFSYTTLYDVLHNDDDLKKKLSWNVRMQIALGAAKALEYLHEGCQPPIVHQRFDPSTILINDDLAVQVSECGLAPLPLSGSETELSGRLPSLFSYDAPEVNESGLYSEKSDVYSFGIIMLELLTGRKPLDRSLPWEEQHLVRWASSQLYDIDALIKMMDPSIGGQYLVKSLSRFADIISRCIQQDPEFRPPMSEVVQDLVRVI